MLKASDFLKPRNRYRRGTIHRVNWNRLFQEIGSHDWSNCDNMMCDDHYGLIVSCTCTNVESAMVIPIKTDRGGTRAYDTRMEFCIKDGHPSLLCIDQMSSMPLECIDPNEYGELRENALEEVFRYIDIMTGRQNGSIPSKVTFKDTDLVEEKVEANPEIPDLKASMNSYIYNHYQRNKEYIYRVRVSEVREGFNKVHADQYAPVDEDTFEVTLGKIGFKVSTLHKERVIWGLHKKGIDIVKEFNSSTNEELMKKFCLSVHEVKDIRYHLRNDESEKSKVSKVDRPIRKRMSQSEWSEIVDLYLEGDNIEEISKAYNVGKSTIYTHFKKAGVTLRKG